MQLTITGKLHFNMTLCFSILCKIYVLLYTIQLSIEAMGGGWGSGSNTSSMLIHIELFVFYVL